jgi:nicotinate-nucleotide adenylyltransferase
MKNIALLGLSANPPTKGHIQLAQFVLNTSGEFDEVWLMPMYTHVYNKDMVSDEHRLKMCEIAAKVDGRIKVFDYEIKNKLSGETYNLFKRLKQEEFNNTYNFSMIIGLDNANTFDKWVNFQELERMVRFVIVPRKGYERDENVTWYLEKPHIYFKDECNIIEISSSFIREKLKDFYNNSKSDDLSMLKSNLNSDVLKYILNNNLFKQY